MAFSIAAFVTNPANADKLCRANPYLVAMAFTLLKDNPDKQEESYRRWLNLTAPDEFRSAALSNDARYAMVVAKDLYKKYLLSQQSKSLEKVPLKVLFNYSTKKGKQNLIAGVTITWIKKPVSDERVRKEISNLVTAKGYTFETGYIWNAITLSTAMAGVMNKEKWNQVLEEILEGWEYEYCFE